MFPNKEKWLEISDEIYETCKFPNCLGFVDARHFRITAPKKSGSTFYSKHKKMHSIVLMATCDKNYRFTWISVGDYGDYKFI